MWTTIARAWYCDSDDSVKGNSSTESISSDTDLTLELEDLYISEIEQTESDAEDSGALSHQSLSIKKLAISENQRYEDPGDNPTQNPSNIDPDFNKSNNTKKLQSRAVDH
jgi:hypothetical protein